MNPKIITRNTTWTDVPPCNGCRQPFPLVVRVGEVPNYESSTILLCPTCLRTALALAETQ